MLKMFFSYLDMSLPFFEADGYNGIEKEMTKVFDATQEFAKEENNLFKNLDQNDIAQLEKKNQNNHDQNNHAKFELKSEMFTFVFISKVKKKIIRHVL